MRSVKIVFIMALALVMFPTSTIFAETAGNRGKIVSRGEDGSVCYERDVIEAEQFLKNMESEEKIGKLKEAFDMATGPSPGCVPEKGYDRIYGIIERTYKKLGEQAENGGRFYEAYNYYIYPYDRFFRPNLSYWDRIKQSYSLTDAHRTMFAYAKVNHDDYEIVQEAINYFKSHDVDPPELKEAYDLAIQGGDKLLAREEKDFAAGSYKAALEDLQESKRWFDLAENDRRYEARAKQRGETLLAESSYELIEHTFDYSYNFSYPNLDSARARAGKLGDEAVQRGDLELAEKFYSLAGDDAKHDAIANKREMIQEQKERQHEETESKRQDQFQKDQKSLEKELGL